MRRWWLIVLCVLLGAVVNVLVAWAFDLLVRPGIGSIRTEFDVPWPAPVPASWGQSSRFWARRSGLLETPGGNQLLLSSQSTPDGQPEA
jgi:hypothetical protein